MGLVNLKANEIIHKKGDTVETIEIVVKGKVCVTIDGESITVEVGGILGAAEHPGKKYAFTYTSMEESAVYSYPYSSQDDLYKVVSSNPKISPILAAQTIKIIVSSIDKYNDDYDKICAEIEQIKKDAQEYPVMAISVGQEVEHFPEIENVNPPEKVSALSEWQEKFYRTMASKEDLLKKYCYGLSADIANGMILYSIQALSFNAACRLELAEYYENMTKQVAKFKSTMQLVRAKANDMKRNGTEGQATDIDIKDALNTILQYADADEKATANFREIIKEFKATPGRYDSSDESRALRRKVAQDYYTIYTSAFLRSLSDPMVPSEVMMFLMFGFVDEELAGLENTRQLYVLMKTYKPDPEGLVMTCYEWLKKVYGMQREPSRNEFDEDYFTALRTLKTSGDISEAQMEEMKMDPLERLKFEVKNLLALGNRMSFGRPSMYVPVFDSENVVRPLDTAYVDYKKIHDFYDYIRSVDYSVFCRGGLYSNVEINVPQVLLNEDVTPIMILMPNMGSRAAVWQEIEGKKRNTPARLIISIFNTETLDDILIKLCGEFRWEMCKTEQGVHWNDVTDPSLTSMYCDYLQFYKKNHSLSTDMKEKLKTQLQKFNNNYKNVFVSDYISYIKFEANASPRLNKIAREILFTFCPFSKELREKMADNPQYGELIKKFTAHNAGLARPLTNIMKRLQNEGIEIPDELKTQYEFFKK
ncbi:cyclic nucleotide-binding domain-containing protein [Butyrivibrio sp. WCD3002]|uniref:cyclic nucleotide-binding domain-containing protein n=1 Tax=Butyrivibrio sp. WCD3002 TaxID=1280676 RepID=UPI0004226C71|nr:cyclic nucleotide-binding domain-containing protein [Butyrivibrio sp. WCD3002]